MILLGLASKEAQELPQTSPFSHQFHQPLYSRPASLVRLALLYLFIAAVFSPRTQGQSKDPDEIPLPDAVVSRLPEDWRATVTKYVKPRKGYEGEYAGKSDAELRTSMLSSLSFDEGPEEFVIAHLHEAVPGRDLLVLAVNIGWQKHWFGHPGVDAELEKLAVSVPDEQIAQACLNAARELEMNRLRATLDERIARQDTARTPEQLAQLREEDERWISLVNGTMLPAFMRRVPPMFDAKPGASSIRVLAFGDFGFCREKDGRIQGDKNQGQDAAAMVAYHGAHPFDFGITLGDNFYPEGMNSPDDPRWKACWEDLYGPMKIKFYPVYGNHDWYGADSPAAELLYTAKSPTWDMRAPYYTYTAGPVQFFAIDTNHISKAQAAWLTQALEQSHARWKVVYGHFPPYIASPVRTADESVVEALMPILKGRADIYIAGHHHSLEHLKPVDGVNLFIAGGGGATSYDVDQHSPVGIFAKSEYGFAVIEADEHNFTVRFIDKNSKVLDESTIHK
jgi:hypothetical protein